MRYEASPSPGYPRPAESQASPLPGNVLASFELAIELIDERGNLEYRPEYEEESGEYGLEGERENVDPEQYLWEHRTFLSRKVEREVHGRLQLAPYRNHVRFSLKIKRGSITAAATIYLVGKALWDFVSTYPDFYEGLNFIIDQVQDILSSNVEEILPAGGGPYPSTSASVQVVDVNTPDLQAIGQQRRTRRIPWSPRTIARNLVRAAGILIVVIYLLSRLPATRPFMGELWPLPNLTSQILYLVSGDGQVRQANFTVSNQGIGPAEGVYINIDALQSRLTSYRIIPQEAFQVVEADLQKGVIRVSLERMAAGSAVEVLVDSDQNLSISDIRFSAVSKSGASQVRPPEERSSLPLGLRYIPAGEPLALAAKAFISNLLISTGQSEEQLTWDSFVADFLRLAATGLIIAVLAGMIFNFLVFQYVILAEILALAFIFFYPIQMPAEGIAFITFMLALYAVCIYAVIAKKRNELAYNWRGWHQWPYLNFQALTLLVASLLVVALLLIFSWAVYSDAQVSVVWLVAVLVIATGGVIYWNKIGLLRAVRER